MKVNKDSKIVANDESGSAPQAKAPEAPFQNNESGAASLGEVLWDQFVKEPVKKVIHVVQEFKPHPLIPSAPISPVQEGTLSSSQLPSEFEKAGLIIVPDDQVITQHKSAPYNNFEAHDYRLRINPKARVWKIECQGESFYVYRGEGVDRTALTANKIKKVVEENGLQENLKVNDIPVTETKEIYLNGEFKKTPAWAGTANVEPVVPQGPVEVDMARLSVDAENYGIGRVEIHGTLPNGGEGTVAAIVKTMDQNGRSGGTYLYVEEGIELTVIQDGKKISVVGNDLGTGVLLNAGDVIEGPSGGPPIKIVDSREIPTEPLRPVSNPVMDLDYDALFDGQVGEVIQDGEVIAQYQIKEGKLQFTLKSGHSLNVFEDRGKYTIGNKDIMVTREFDWKYVDKIEVQGPGQEVIVEYKPKASARPLLASVAEDTSNNGNKVTIKDYSETMDPVTGITRRDYPDGRVEYSWRQKSTSPKTSSSPLPDLTEDTAKLGPIDDGVNSYEVYVTPEGQQVNVLNDAKPTSQGPGEAYQPILDKINASGVGGLSIDNPDLIGTKVLVTGGELSPMILVAIEQVDPMNGKVLIDTGKQGKIWIPLDHVREFGEIKDSSFGGELWDLYHSKKSQGVGSTPASSSPEVEVKPPVETSIKVKGNIAEPYAGPRNVWGGEYGGAGVESFKNGAYLVAGYGLTYLVENTFGIKLSSGGKAVTMMLPSAYPLIQGAKSLYSGYVANGASSGMAVGKTGLTLGWNFLGGLGVTLGTNYALQKAGVDSTEAEIVSMGAGFAYGAAPFAVSGLTTAGAGAGATGAAGVGVAGGFLVAGAFLVGYGIGKGLDKLSGGRISDGGASLIGKADEGYTFLADEVFTDKGENKRIWKAKKEKWARAEQQKGNEERKTREGEKTKQLKSQEDLKKAPQNTVTSTADTYLQFMKQANTNPTDGTILLNLQNMGVPEKGIGENDYFYQQRVKGSPRVTVEIVGENLEAYHVTIEKSGSHEKISILWKPGEEPYVEVSAGNSSSGNQSSFEVAPPSGLDLI